MEIDPRGPRVGALITTVVLGVVLVTGSLWLLVAQALVFAAGALFVFGFCLGCEMYLLIRRFRAGRTPLAADR